MNNENKSLDTKITLLDFLVVLIRYRKLICLTTFVVFVFSFSWNVILPKFVKQYSEKEVQIIYSGAYEKMAPELTSYLNIDIARLSEKELKEYSNFAKVQKKFNVFSSENLSLREYNSLVKDIMDEKRFEVKSLWDSSQFKIIATVPESKADNYRDFINEYIHFCSEIVEGKISESIDSARQNLEELIEKNNTSENKNANLEKLISLQLSIKNFSDTHKQIVFLEGEPFESTISINKMRKVILFTGFAFVASIVFAFIINLIRVLKKDPEVCELISDAWKAGK